MEKVYFISDVHLGAHSPRIEEIKLQRLSSFLTGIRNHANILYIVGDLYDFWFEYRHAIPKVSLQVLFQLNQLVEAGVQIRYFTGNHDLWIGDYLQTQIGFEVYREPFSVTHNNVQLFIAHGDGLAKGEKRLRILKRIFKNPINIALYRLIHPDLGLPLMKLFAKKSRERGQNPYGADYREFATSKISEGFDAVILGHTHKPLFEEIDSGYYINLGDWITNFTYLELAGTKLEFKSWPNNDSEKFVPKLLKTSKV